MDHKGNKGSKTKEPLKTKGPKTKGLVTNGPNGSNGPNRWVGFDMDECLGSFMSLWPFCDLLPDEANMSYSEKQAYLDAIAEHIAVSKKHWLFRPGLSTLLKALTRAKERHEINGCFILTNNGSDELMEVVRRALNIQANTGLFVTGWHRNLPCRKKSATGSILTKDLKCIVECMRASLMTPISSIHDLLYYDDLATHDLAKQIPNYVTVPAYSHYTPVSIVFHDLKAIIHRFGVAQKVVDHILSLAHKYEDDDVKSDKSLLLYSPVREKDYMHEFIQGFANFTRKSPTPRTHKSTTRKNVGNVGVTKKTRRYSRSSKN